MNPMQRYASVMFIRGETNRYAGETDGDAIQMAFSKKAVEDRKTWLSNFVPGTFLDSDAAKISYSDFVHKVRNRWVLVGRTRLKSAPIIVSSCTIATLLYALLSASTLTLGCVHVQELILFSRADLERSIPSMVDGLKPGQRKIMFSCFKRNLKDDIKVRSLVSGLGQHHAPPCTLCMEHERKQH
jgi:DNA topoisomerase II